MQLTAKLMRLYGVVAVGEMYAQLTSDDRPLVGAVICNAALLQQLNLSIQATIVANVSSRKSPRTPAPLTEEEEAAWRALARAVLVIPRVLDADMSENQGLNITEYNVLMNLSEAPNRSLRMSELANYVAISDGGLTRVVDRLSRRGFVERVRAQEDGRGQVAVLTRAGLTRLKQAWPTHLATVRQHIMDHLQGLDLVSLTDALTKIASAELGPPLRQSAPSAR